VYVKCQPVYSQSHMVVTLSSVDNFLLLICVCTWGFVSLVTDVSPVILFWRIQHIYTENTPYLYREYNTSIPRIQHIYTENTTYPYRKYNISIPRIQHIYTENSTKPYGEYNISIRKIQHIYTENSTKPIHVDVKNSTYRPRSFSHADFRPSIPSFV